jgi:hypothetical protein
MQIFENLQEYLASEELARASSRGLPAESTRGGIDQIPVLVGGHLKHYVVGTGGYAMNRAALRLFATSMYKSSCFPRAVSPAEDFRLTQCLAANGGRMPNTR